MVTIDSKRRFCVPSAFRDVVRGMEDEGQNLFMVPDIGVGTLYVKPLKHIFNKAAIEDIAPFVTPIPSLSKDVRFVIPPSIMDACGFQPKTTYVTSGHGEYFAIRTPEAWKDFIALRK